MSVAAQVTLPYEVPTLYSAAKRGINLELHLQRTLEIKLVYSPRTQCPSAMEKEAA